MFKCQWISNEDCWGGTFLLFPRAREQGGQVPPDAFQWEIFAYLYLPVLGKERQGKKGKGEE